MRFRKTSLIAASVSVLLLGYLFARGPLLVQMPEGWIESHLLREHPLGSSKDRVIAALRSQQVERLRLAAPQERFSNQAERMKASYSVSEAIFYRIYLGKYRGLPWQIDVSAFFVFDKDEALIEIHVTKESDAI